MKMNPKQTEISAGNAKLMANLCACLAQNLHIFTDAVDKCNFNVMHAAANTLVCQAKELAWTVDMMQLLIQHERMTDNMMKFRSESN